MSQLYNMIKMTKVDVPEGVSGEWTIERFTLSPKDVDLHNLRCRFHPGEGNRTIEPGTYTRLMRKGTLVMSDTNAEKMDHLCFIHEAKGSVLINGLGLGWVIEALFHKDEVTSITVIEKSLDLISMVGKHYLNKLPQGKTLTFIHADALAYKPPKGVKYNAVWHDIWDNICADNLTDMKTLHRKYGNKTDWQGSWGRELCEMNR
jgi:hypothetical protein